MTINNFIDAKARTFFFKIEELINIIWIIIIMLSKSELVLYYNFFLGRPQHFLLHQGLQSSRSGTYFLPSIISTSTCAAVLSRSSLWWFWICCHCDHTAILKFINTNDLKPDNSFKLHLSSNLIDHIHFIHYYSGTVSVIHDCIPDK